MEATRFGHTETVKALLECEHIDIYLQNNEGLTALKLASNLEYFEIVQAILSLRVQHVQEHKTKNKNTHNKK